MLLVGLQDRLVTLLEVHVLIVSRLDIGQEAVVRLVLGQVHLVLVDVPAQVMVVVHVQLV